MKYVLIIAIFLISCSGSEGVGTSVPTIQDKVTEQKTGNTETKTEIKTDVATTETTETTKTVAVKQDAKVEAKTEILSASQTTVIIPLAITTVLNPSININAGSIYTNNSNVTLTLSASNAVQMYVTNTIDCEDGGVWETYAASKSWPLNQPNTVAAVYVKYRDTQDAESSCVSDTIIHDSIPPTNASITTENTTSNTHITLSLAAISATQVYISNTSCNINGTWETFNTTKTWTISQVNIANTIYAKFKDIAGNETACLNTTITHQDNQAPSSISISINTGNKTTITTNVTLLLGASDSELTSVNISNSTNCTGGSWEDFIANSNSNYQKSWVLSSSFGIAYVSAKFKDISGNESACTTASINVVATNTAAEIVTGLAHTCIRNSDGKVICFGRNNYGQLGYGYAQLLSDVSTIGRSLSTVGTNKSFIDLGTGRTALQLALGQEHTCALRDNGTVVCWGRNQYGQLGQGHTNTLGINNDMGDAIPTVNLGGTATQITAGAFHTCAIMSNGSVKCWGLNNKAQLGIGNIVNIGDQTNPVFTSVDLGTGKTATQISAGFEITCAVLNDQRAKCWGQNYNLQSGQGGVADFYHDGTYLIGDHANELGDTLQPIKLGVGKTVRKVAVGFYHICALMTDNGVKCWGKPTSDINAYEGQLGYNGITQATGDNTPYVNFGPSYMSVTDISANQNTTCVVAAGKTKCWGKSDTGQIGQDSMATIGNKAYDDMSNDIVFPWINIGIGKTVNTVSAGKNHTCITSTDGTAKCWGLGGNGQLGQGNSNVLGINAGEMASINEI